MAWGDTKDAGLTNKSRTQDKRYQAKSDRVSNSDRANKTQERKGKGV